MHSLSALIRSTCRWHSAGILAALLAAAALFSPHAAFAFEPDSSSTPGANWMQGSHAGQERSDNGLRLKLAWCPPGKFHMGRQESQQDPQDPRPLLEVTLTRGFWLGKFEVTQAEYTAVVHNNPSYFSAEGEGKASVAGHDTARFPVERVSWDEATEFCRRLTARERQLAHLPEGWEYTLPTEAQWEYACRAGTTTAYHFGDELDPRSLNAAAGEDVFGGANGVLIEPTTITVGVYPSNAWGLHDMHGNAWEWCRDHFTLTANLPGGIDPEVTAQNNPAPQPRYTRLWRGGGVDCSAYVCTAAYRRAIPHDFKSNYLGFRVALVRTAN